MINRGSPGKQPPSGLEIEQIEVPSTFDGDDAVAFGDYVRVRNAVEADVLGTELLSPSAQQLRSNFANNPNRVRHLFMARLDGVPIGCGMTTVRVQDLAAGAHVVADVLPHARGAGVGAALFDAATRAAREAGCTLLLVNTPHSADAGGARITSSTGFGDVSAINPGARFLASRGFTLEQVNRISMLPTKGLDQAPAPLEQEAAYRTHTWHGPTRRRGWTTWPYSGPA